MPVLALRVTAHNGLTPKQKKAMRVTAAFVDLGVGALYEAVDPDNPPDMQDWLVYADARFDLEAAALAAVGFRQPQFLPDPDGPNGPKPRNVLRADIKAAFNWDVPVIPEGEDPYAYTAAHNNALPTLGMWNELPAGFTPKDT